MPTQSTMFFNYVLKIKIISSMNAVLLFSVLIDWSYIVWVETSQVEPINLASLIFDSQSSYELASTDNELVGFEN